MKDKFATLFWISRRVGETAKFINSAIHLAFKKQISGIYWCTSKTTSGLLSTYHNGTNGILTK